MQEYVQRKQATIDDYIETCPVYELFTEVERV